MINDISHPGESNDKSLTTVNSILISKWRELLAGSLFVLFFLLFTVISPGFGSSRVFSVILLHGAELGIIAIGPTLLIISGEMDLSVASVYAFSIFVIFTFANWGFPLVVCFLLALAYGALAGLINGILTLKFRIASFITTFGTLVFWRTALAGLTGGDATYFRGDNTVIVNLFGGNFGIIPKQFLWFLVFAVTFSLILNRSKLGNHIMATGGNAKTAAAMGVNTYRTKLICFVISSTLAAFSGAMLTARINYIDPIIGLGLEFEAVAAAVIGGTLLTGGIGSITATSIGAFLLKQIQHGVAMYGVKVEYYRVVIGVLLVLAAIVNTQMTRRILKIEN